MESRRVREVVEKMPQRQAQTRSSFEDYRSNPEWYEESAVINSSPPLKIDKEPATLVRNFTIAQGTTYERHSCTKN